MKQHIGYILHESVTDDIVVIATIHSANRKTGDMVQVWILNRSVNPVEAVKTGLDATVCFDCIHRGDGFKYRTCYVNVGQGPNSVYRAYKAGKYPVLHTGDYGEVFKGRNVRLGAYGDPVLIPIWILVSLVYACKDNTGYTHQWQLDKYQSYSRYLMASCDSVGDYERAKALGWRTFRVRTPDQPLASREIQCPASDEAGHKTTCDQCCLCNGSKHRDKRADIAIVVHGVGASNFNSLVQIGV